MFPAWFDFHKDKEINKHPAAGRVYAAILGLENILFVPRAVKAWVLAEGLGIRKKSVIRSLNLLVQRGYLIEHERDTNNVRRFTVAGTRHPKPGTSSPNDTHTSAA